MPTLLKSALGWAATIAVAVAIATAMVAEWGLYAYGSAYAIPALARARA